MPYPEAMGSLDAVGMENAGHGVPGLVTGAPAAERTRNDGTGTTSKAGTNESPPCVAPTSGRFSGDRSPRWRLRSMLNI